MNEGTTLNFFVYPYVEVDGAPWPEANVELSLAYRDVERTEGEGKRRRTEER